MAIQIRLKRGTKAQLDVLMATTPMLSGEMGYTSDTNEVYVSDGTAAHLVGRVLVNVIASRPAAGVSGRVFHATDTEATYVDNGTTWVDVSSGISDLDDIADGTTYGKVLNTYLDGNRPDSLWDGSQQLTGSGISAHINDVDIHREINDAGTAATDLWSADKIGVEIDQAIAGLDFQADVANVQTDALLDPGAPATEGDRYIITSSGTLHANFGVIAGLEDGDIVEYNGSAFVVAYDVSVAGEGALAWNETSDTFMRWDGTSWAEFGGLSGVTAGLGLTKSGNTMNVGAGDGISVASDTVSVNASDLAGQGISVDGSNNLRIGGQGNGIDGGDGTTLSILADTSGAANIAPVSVTASGIGVLIDHDSLDHTTGVIEVVKVDGGTFA